MWDACADTQALGAPMLTPFEDVYRVEGPRVRQPPIRLNPADSGTSHGRSGSRANSQGRTRSGGTGPPSSRCLGLLAEQRTLMRVRGSRRKGGGGGGSNAADERAWAWGEAGAGAGAHGGGIPPIGAGYSRCQRGGGAAGVEPPAGLPGDTLQQDLGRFPLRQASQAQRGRRVRPRLESLRFSRYAVLCSTPGRGHPQPPPPRSPPSAAAAPNNSRRAGR